MDFTKVMGEKLEGIEIIKRCSTKLDESMTKEEAVKTEVVIDLRDLTLEQLIHKYATSKMVIECQKIWRTKGEIPEEYRYKPQPTTVRAPKKVNVDKMSDDQALELLKKLQARFKIGG